MKRGEVRWYVFKTPDKRRPVMILTRDAVLASLNESIVVPATTTIRGLVSEVVLTPEDGMPKPCALNFDHIGVVRKNRLGPLLCTIPEARWEEVRYALLAACGF